MENNVDELKKQRDRSRILNIILIIIIIILLLLGYVVGSKIGKIGLKSKETTTQPEEITQEEKLIPEIEITQDDIDVTKEMQYHVNMKYKLKLDNVYIKGNKEEYKKLEDIKLKEVIVPKDSANIYTLEWYWEDDDKNDTIVGSQQDKQYYKLNLEINARQYAK